MEYDFRKIEEHWQTQWNKDKTYNVPNDFTKPKCYVLDMFPYPSGAGLHVGHPLGYIASDIYSRYKRLKGFNVLHPMGYDAFGLPAEQYAIEHGIHPAIATEQNIGNFRKQLDNIGFCYDWSRTLRTSDPQYYKWTQWIFLQLFNSFYNRKTNKAESIDTLVAAFESAGNAANPCPGDATIAFTAEEWKAYNEKQQQHILMQYRLAFCGIGEVNWCEALGTVLANDEVVNGVSERGGYPVVKKKLRQWYLRITEYADRLLQGLETVDYSDAMKEMQTNWIGKSYGAEIDFGIAGHDEKLRVFTTRPDTIFGVDFMVIAPEHELVEKITTKKHRQEIDDYLSLVKSRSERERMAEKQVSGAFTGAYAINPFDGREIPVYIAEYVLAGYGTGAIMAVPCGDERDFKFAQHFNINITNILGDQFDGTSANPTKEAQLYNSNFLTGMMMKDATKVVLDDLEGLGYGKAKVNYKMRDAAFSRQRYWGEPVPIVWKNDIAYPLSENQLPLTLPRVESYTPGPDGAGPLENIPEWLNQYNGDNAAPCGKLESSTMPGYAGSSWYFLRYMDPHNENTFCDRTISDYWNQVDLYIGGTEHAVGHLLYSRMWTKALFDLGHIGFDEPYKKLVNQGMITGSSRLISRVQLSGHRVEDTTIAYTADPVFVSYDLVADFASRKDQDATALANKLSEVSNYLRSLLNEHTITACTINSLHVNVNIVDGFELDVNRYREEKPDLANAEFICNSDGKFLCSAETEKMSKRYFNTVDPTDLCNKYGADTFRMYEMFLGPVEQSKPWDTKGIEGVHRFLKKLWRLFFDDIKGSVWNDETPTAPELKTLHKTIKKIEEDTERFAFNTAVSAFMVCVNELSDLKCRKKAILEPLLILLTPYAPHICEELWHVLGNQSTILDAPYPIFVPAHIAESSKEYPVSINGKVRASISLPVDIKPAEAEKLVLENEVVQKWLEGKQLKKFIFVPGRMINLVV